MHEKKPARGLVLVRINHAGGEGGISFADPVAGGASEAETRRCFAPAGFSFLSSLKLTSLAPKTKNPQLSLRVSAFWR